MSPPKKKGAATSAQNEYQPDVAVNPAGPGIGDFIERYIFPGGALLHVSKVTEVMSEARPKGDTSAYTVVRPKE